MIGYLTSVVNSQAVSWTGAKTNVGEFYKCCHPETKQGVCVCVEEVTSVAIGHVKQRPSQTRAGIEPMSYGEMLRALPTEHPPPSPNPLQ